MGVFCYMCRVRFFFKGFSIFLSGCVGVRFGEVGGRVVGCLGYNEWEELGDWEVEVVVLLSYRGSG